jgi:hypothetical protein
MARIRLNLRNLTITEKIARSRQIVAAMTNNASFPNPQPPLTDVTTAVDDLEETFASVQAAKSEVTTRVVTQDNADTKLVQTLTQLAGYVESVAGKNDAYLSWKPVSNARSYAIEFSLDPAAAGSWTHVGIATSSSKVIPNLTSGKRYWFRVAAIGSVGQSGWSEHATKIVPSTRRCARCFATTSAWSSSHSMS